MKKIVFNLFLLFLPIFTVMAAPGNPVVTPKAPIDQYDYTLIIAAVVILALSALFIMRKKLKKA